MSKMREAFARFLDSLPFPAPSDRQGGDISRAVAEKLFKTSFEAGYQAAIAAVKEGGVTI